MNSQKGIGGIEMKLNKKALQFNLQFFAEPGEGDPATQQPPTTESTSCLLYTSDAADD